jgi:hypothetical protein
MATHQGPWASGRRRAPQKSPIRRRVDGIKKGFGRAMRKHPWIGLLLQIVFAVLAVALLVTGLLLENVLFFLATTMSALGGVATRRAIFLEQERQRQQSGPKVSRPRPAGSGPRTSTPKAGGAAPPPSAGGVVKCTETGKPIKDCGCSSRHVATPEGAQTYGKPVGSPIGRKNKKQSSAGGTVKTGG